MKKIIRKMGFLEPYELPTVEFYNFSLTIKYLSFIFSIGAFIGMIWYWIVN
jgi:hypothetical protein